MTIDMLKARFASMPKLFSDKGGMLVVQDNLPISFFVLVGEFSSKGLWYHPVGVHWQDGKQTVCRELEEAGVCSVCERIREMEKHGFPESQIFKLRAPEKIAMNVVVKGEETPKVFLAPMTVGRKIDDVWKKVLDAENIDIFDPWKSIC